MRKATEKSAGRIGYLLRAYPRFSQTFVVNEMLELERQGADLRIGSLRRPTDGVFHDSIARMRASCDYLPDYFWENLGKIREAHRLCRGRAARGWRGALLHTLRRRAIEWFDFVQAGLVVRWAERRACRHLHVHFGTNEATVAWLARQMGGPTYSLTLHAFDIFRDNVDRALLARKINDSAFTVTVCESNRRFMLENLPGVRPERIRVNYNGVDLERFAPTQRPREPLTILAVGRLIEKKGFADLVRAVARLVESGMALRCRIAGDGPEERSLKSLIGELRVGQHVELLGPLRQEQVREHLQTSACLALPCIQAADGNVDALPTVLLEAQAAGCPVVSTRVSGVPEIIEDGVSGMLADPGDSVGLARCLARLLSDAELAGALSRGGRLRAVERFDVRRNVATMRAWFEHALRGECETAPGDAPLPEALPEAVA